MATVKDATAPKVLAVVLTIVFIAVSSSVMSGSCRGVRFYAKVCIAPPAAVSITAGGSPGMSSLMFLSGC
jgi:hypothetical protein